MPEERPEVATNGPHIVTRTAMVSLTAYPEPTLWEVAVRCPDLGWNFTIAIGREDAPTEERALELAEVWLETKVAEGTGDGR